MFVDHSLKGFFCFRFQVIWMSSRDWWGANAPPDPGGYACRGRSPSPTWRGPRSPSPTRRRLRSPSPLRRRRTPSPGQYVPGNRSRTLRRYAWENPVSDIYESRRQFRDEDESAYESRGIYRDRVPYGHDFGVRQEGRHYPLESFSRGSDSHESLYSSNREWEDMDHYLRERELRLVTREEKLSTREEDVAQRESLVLSREMEVSRQRAKEDRRAQDEREN